jgi:hypothetical protein
VEQYSVGSFPALCKKLLGNPKVFPGWASFVAGYSFPKPLNQPENCIPFGRIVVIRGACCEHLPGVKGSALLKRLNQRLPQQQRQSLVEAERREPSGFCTELESQHHTTCGMLISSSPEASVLELCVFRLGEVNVSKTQGMIITRRVSFEVALFKTVADQRRENTGNYHNPTRQRGIYGDIGKTRNHNPSLTRRVGIGTTAQLQKASARDVMKMLAKIENTIPH